MSKWIHEHFSESENENVVEDIETFINTYRPNLDGIQGGLSHGRDFHIWARQGDNSTGKRIYLKSMEWTDSSPDVIETLLDGGKINLLSLNVESPPKFWYFEEVSAP